MVLLKETADTEAKIEIDPQGKQLSFGAQKPIVNPYDEFAVEAAVSLKEKMGGDTEVIAASYGPATVKDRMMRALAMGADRGALVVAPSGEALDGLALAQVFAALAKKEDVQMIWCGKQAIDDDNMHMVPMLAEKLGWGHVNVVGAMEWNGTDGFTNLAREVDGGQTEHYTAKLPLVLGANKSLNKPRYAPVPKVLQAKKKPFAQLSVEDLGLNMETLLAGVLTEVDSLELPPAKPAGRMVEGETVEAMVSNLVTLLRDEAKVL
ncbi:MAG: electron transfer flavoprotein subunit beta/FixA family protein [Zetaproteobacteria bacterium]|nr:electron transfer flavoprotein subunit beta/FixA family protein [Zetaproteobacteria bacterium]